MKFEITREWLAKKLERCDDLNVGAGGTRFEQFERDVEERTVTPSALANVPSELGKAVRFVREQKGWTISELAQLADIDEAELLLLEAQENYDPTPRTVTQLADVCRFSRARFINLANHRRTQAANEDILRFAARSKSINAVSDEEYETIRALVETLLERPKDNL